ncbi:ribosome maturation factor RimM [Aquibium sp. ELW1220]|uniref:ribosome maturation factor RimM n=1 Tax=Aquibium sp. ELW1220 TaxID=2976766 RepID=UPI0025B1B568|nr:ribosome maturation factor RimM [Aquibium sp. ELW1220]MDN2582279.1 ribosome maturation factor RimM [Aquibium sp. ELW1220]
MPLELEAGRKDVTTKLEHPVLMAVIGAAHGIKGEVRVKSFTGDPEALGDYGPLVTADGRVFEVLGLRPQKEVVVVRFKGVKDRNAAEALAGTELFVDRSALPPVADEEEFYHADLVGLAVVDTEGVRLGTVKTMHDYGGGDIVEVALTGARSVLVPFTKAAVPAIDVAARIMTVDRVAAGLVEDEDDDAPQDGRPPRGTDRPRGPKPSGGDR